MAPKYLIFGLTLVFEDRFWRKKMTRIRRRRRSEKANKRLKCFDFLKRGC